jgi:nucleoid-associated protein YgaU
MTRETKIGLLVGLAFIIVIGILLSEQLTRSTEAPPAPISMVGDSVRTSVASAQNPAAGDAAAPHDPIPTNGDINAHPRGQAVVVVGPANARPAASNVPSNPGSAVVANRTNQPGPRDPRLSAAPGEIVALQRPEAPGQYKAVAGDSLSRMAAHFLGSDTPANRQALMRVNPSLAQNPDMVLVGYTYVIPSASISTADNPAAAAPSAAPSAQPTHWYTIKKGDTLWRIATQQVGTSAAVGAIQELNKDLLKGSTTLHEGMQLRLPAKPIASAN